MFANFCILLVISDAYYIQGVGYGLGKYMIPGGGVEVPKGTESPPHP